jgi:hypothetical protein
MQPRSTNRQVHQSALRVDHVNQTRTQQVVLFLMVRTVLHGWNRNCRASEEIMQNPASHGEKNRNISTQNQ